ncbi:DUF2846 domain-containing protein [Dyella kyungheensis]|jgi:uncharacterized protein YceK|uniref:DUF2846 domain-containing protein n=1 Tax=Dyella kyungheensis TaxID=1242174 RepID=UPI003CEFF413
MTGLLKRADAASRSSQYTGENMIRKFVTAMSIIAMLVLSGCASVPMASKNDDAMAKQFRPSTDKAVVYVYRNETMGAAIKMPLLIDGQSVGDTAAKTYLRRELAPGSHTIVSKTEEDSTLTLDMQAGKTYFVWQEVKMGMFAARSALHQVDETKGRAAIEKCTLIL